MAKIDESMIRSVFEKIVELTAEKRVTWIDTRGEWSDELKLEYGPYDIYVSETEFRVTDAAGVQLVSIKFHGGIANELDVPKLYELADESIYRRREKLVDLDFLLDVPEQVNPRPKESDNEKEKPSAKDDLPF